MEGLDAQHEDLPDADAEHPNVAGGREAAEVDAFRRHPLDGQFAFRGFVVRIVLDPSGEAEIGEFDTIVTRDEDVSGRDVAMNELFRLEVAQCGGQLIRVQDQRGQFEAMSVVLQVSSKFAVSRPLHDDPDGRGRADPDEFDDVLMVELLHDVRLFEKLFRDAIFAFDFTRLDGHGHESVGAGLEHAFVDVAELALADDVVEFDAISLNFVVASGTRVVGLVLVLDDLGVILAPNLTRLTRLGIYRREKARVKTLVCNFRMHFYVTFFLPNGMQSLRVTHGKKRKVTYWAKEEGKKRNKLHTSTIKVKPSKRN